MATCTEWLLLLDLWEDWWPHGDTHSAQRTRGVAITTPDKLLSLYCGARLKVWDCRGLGCCFSSVCLGRACLYTSYYTFLTLLRCGSEQPAFCSTFSCVSTEQLVDLPVCLSVRHPRAATFPCWQHVHTSRLPLLLVLTLEDWLSAGCIVASSHIGSFVHTKQRHDTGIGALEEKSQSYAWYHTTSLNHFSCL